MAVYTNNTPQASQTIAFTQPLIEGNFEYLENTIDEDHNFSGNDANATDGYHKVIHHILNADPAPIATIQQTYSFNDAGTTQLRSMNGTGGISRLTGDLQNQNGYQWIGGVLFQWGRETSTATDSSTNFPIPFPNAVYSVNMTPLISATTGHAAGTYLRIPLTNIAFSWTQATQASTQIGFFWMAVGN